MINWTKKIEVHSYKEYLKEVEKKMELKEDFLEGSYVSYQVKDVKTAKQLLKKAPTDNNVYSILKEFTEHYRDAAVDIDGKCDRLIGIELTHEDYYYILSDEKNCWFESCVGELNYVK